MATPSSVPKVASVRLTFFRVATGSIRTAEISAAQIGVNVIRGAQVGVAQIGAVQIGAARSAPLRAANGKHLLVTAFGADQEERSCGDQGIMELSKDEIVFYRVRVLPRQIATWEAGVLENDNSACQGKVILYSSVSVGLGRS